MLNLLATEKRWNTVKERSEYNPHTSNLMSVAKATRAVCEHKVLQERKLFLSGFYVLYVCGVKAFKLPDLTLWHLHYCSAVTPWKLLSEYLL